MHDLAYELQYYKALMSTNRLQSRRLLTKLCGSWTANQAPPSGTCNVLTGAVEVLNGGRGDGRQAGQLVQSRHGVCPTWRARGGQRGHEVGAPPGHRRPHYRRLTVGFVCGHRL